MQTKVLVQTRTLAHRSFPQGRYYIMVTDPGIGRYIIEGDSPKAVQAAADKAVARGGLRPSTMRERRA